MSRPLMGWEVRKIVSLPWLWIFLMLCLTFNILNVASSVTNKDYIAYVDSITQTVGRTMGDGFTQALSESAHHPWQDDLLAQTTGVSDVLDGYDASEIPQTYRALYNITGPAYERLVANGERIQSRVDVLGQENASLDLGAGAMTYDVIHSSFYQAVSFPLVLEGILMAVLIALLTTGFEGAASTVVYSTRTGRTLQKTKFVAGVLVSLGLYVLLALATMAVFALLWDLGSIWGANIASQFHTIRVVIRVFPFIPWVDFTFATYVLAVLSLGAGVMILFYLVSFGIGLMVKHSYYGFLALLSLVGLDIGLSMLTGNSSAWGLYQLCSLTPFQQWFTMRTWFTGLSVTSVIPMQECWVVGAWMVLLAMVLHILYRYYLRKDLT